MLGSKDVVSRFFVVRTWKSSNLDRGSNTNGIG